MTAESGEGFAIDHVDQGKAADRRRALESLGLTAAAAAPLKLRSDLRVEELDGELVVLDPSGETVHRVAGDGVAALRILERGVIEREVPLELSAAVDQLIDAGLVAGRRTPSRRAVIAGGAAAWAAATVTTFALADPAAAWSRCKNGKVPTAPDTGSTGKKYTVAGTYTWVSGPSGWHSPNTQQSYNVLVRAWGGGGSGGHDAATLGGGGGGGGAYVHAYISVLECTEYTVTVGAGGTGNSQHGSPSTFKDATTLKAAAGSRGINAAAYDSGDGGPGGKAADCVPSTGSTRYSGGNGGTGGAAWDTACGGGSAGSGGDGGNGSTGSAGGGGAGTPGGAAGGTENQPGNAPGGGGGGGDDTGGNGAAGAVWIGV